MKFMSGILVILLVLIVVGCEGVSRQSKAKIEAPEIGLSMPVPQGWIRDKRNPRLCFKGNYTGTVIDEALEGKDFYAYVEELSKDFGGKVVSKAPLEISGYKAIEAVIEYPDLGNKVIKLFIKKNDRLVEVSFVTSIKDFQKYAPSLRKALKSIEIK